MNAINTATLAQMATASDGAGSTVHEFDDERIHPQSLARLEHLRIQYPDPLLERDMHTQETTYQREGLHVAVVRKGPFAQIVCLSTLKTIMRRITRHEANQRWAWVAESIERCEQFVRESNDPIAISEIDRLIARLQEQPEYLAIRRWAKEYVRERQKQNET